MKKYAYLTTGDTWTEIKNSFIINGVQYPATWPNSASPEELNAISVKEIEESPQPVGEFSSVEYIISNIENAPVQEWIVQELSLETAYEKTWSEVKQYAEAVSSTWFNIPGIGPIQTDDKSLKAIDMIKEEAEDAVREGNTEWTVAFLNKDNEYVTVNASQVFGIKKAIRSFFALGFMAQQLVRQQLLAMETSEQLLNVNISAAFESAVATLSSQ